MKAITSLIIALFLTILLVGCGDSTNPVQTSSTGETLLYSEASQIINTQAWRTLCSLDSLKTIGAVRIEFNAHSDTTYMLWFEGEYHNIDSKILLELAGVTKDTVINKIIDLKIWGNIEWQRIREHGWIYPNYPITVTNLKIWKH
jgi:hypothetical protein